MKNAAKCDTSCDLQNPVNHQNFERILRFRDTPGSMLVGVSVDTTRAPSPRPSSLSLSLSLSSERANEGPARGGADSECSGVSHAPSAPNRVNEASRALPHRVVDGARFGGDSRLTKTCAGHAGCFLPALQHISAGIRTPLSFGPPIKQEDPLNLSI